jgi:hypothetical protein
LEEYAPTFYYIRGLGNVLADYLFHAPLSSPEEKQVASLPPIGIPIDESDTFHSVLLDKPQLLDCFLSFPLDSYLNVPVEVHHNPIDYQRIHALQQAVQMQQFHHHDPVRYPLHTFGQFQIVCYHIPGQHNWRIYLPDAFCPSLYIGIMWFCNIVVPNVCIVLCFFTFIIPNSNLSLQISFAFVVIVRSTNIPVVAMVKCRLVKLFLLLSMKSPLT